MTFFQSTFSQNPYTSIGVKDNDVKALSLSSGKYNEFEQYNEVEKVGSALINMKTMKIVGFIEKDSLQEKATFEPEIVSRWLSIDPLAREYPELTPYQYASNSPIACIDMDGLEAFIIHGSAQNSGATVFSYSVEKELLRISGNKKIYSDFKWTSIIGPAILNKEIDRNFYAKILTAQVIKTRADMLNKGEITKNEPVTLIGYSHGGNIAFQTAGYLSALGINVNVITVATPAYNDQNDAENPANYSGIKSHINFVHKDDPVQAFAGGDRLFKNNKTMNYELNDKDMESTGSIVQWGPHTDLPWSGDFAKFLKTIPTLKWDKSYTKTFDNKYKKVEDTVNGK